MTTIYFNVYNGKAEPPTSIPAYCAVIENEKVAQIKACYAIANIERNGELWALNERLKSEMEWSNYKWLMPNLKSFIAQSEPGRDYARELAPHYEYITVWVREEEHEPK